jgi:hypothetical protein
VIVSWDSLVLDEAIRERHSTRMFLPQSVARALVDESLALAQRAPSSSNIQPWHMVFASGPPRNRLVAALLSEVRRGPLKIPPLAVKSARNLLLGGRELHDAQVYLMLAGGSLIDVFLYRGGVLLIERGRSEGRRRGHVQSGLRNGRQPTELQGGRLHQLSGRIATDCQAKVAMTPMQNATRKRDILRRSRSAATKLRPAFFESSAGGVVACTEGLIGDQTTEYSDRPRSSTEPIAASFQLRPLSCDSCERSKGGEQRRPLSTAAPGDLCGLSAKRVRTAIRVDIQTFAYQRAGSGAGSHGRCWQRRLLRTRSGDTAVRVDAMLLTHL